MANSLVSYRCRKCRHYWEAPFQRKAVPCAQCDSYQSERTDVPLAIIYSSTPNTVGQQAEVNAKRVGKEKMALMSAEYKNAKEKVMKLPRGATRMDKAVADPWYRDGSLPGVQKSDRPIDLKKIKNTHRYIAEGVET